jgi:hypothetical protein
MTMTHGPPAVDISAMPELVRLAEEVCATGQPRALWRGGEEVALLSPPQGKRRAVSTARPRPRKRNRLHSVAERTAGALREYRLEHPLTPEEENEAFERAMAEEASEGLRG